jgi:hypothetical protein
MERRSGIAILFTARYAAFLPFAPARATVMRTVVSPLPRGPLRNAS